MQATDENGNTKWKRDFLPFGMSTSEEGNVDEEAGFTGKDFDEEIGMVYFNARWYDPELGRFAEEDPMADDPNLYSYGFDSPLNYTDPTGMFGIAGYDMDTHEFYGWQCAGSIINAYGCLNPKAAKAGQIYGLFVLLYNWAVKIKQADILLRGDYKRDYRNIPKDFYSPNKPSEPLEPEDDNLGIRWLPIYEYEA